MENQQPDIQNQPLPPSPKTNIWMIVSIVLITAIVVGTIVYFWQQAQQKTELLPGKTTETVSPPVTNESTSSALTSSLEITPLDANWNIYNNPVLGFSLKVPLLMIEPYASCKYVETGSDHSYRPQEGPVPVKIFDSEDTVYIASEYNYQLGGETKDASGRTYFSKCDKITNTMARLVDRANYHSPQWQIIIKTINSDNQLEQFLKNRYGEGCSLGEKKAFTQEGVFDIQIQGDGLDLAETKCPINYATKVLYYPAKQKVAAWDLGQACSFAYPSFEDCKDMEMTDSFRFE